MKILGFNQKRQKILRYFPAISSLCWCLFVVAVTGRADHLGTGTLIGRKDPLKNTSNLREFMPYIFVCGQSCCLKNLHKKVKNSRPVPV
jgi:hypothetical protein